MKATKAVVAGAYGAMILPAPLLAQTQTPVLRAPGGGTIASMPHSGPGLRRAGTAGGYGTDDPVWQQVSVPAGVYIRAISMGSPMVGFAAAEQGVVLRTIDGGNSWQIILSQGFPLYY